MFLLIQNYTGQIKHALHSYLIKSHSYAYKNTYTWNKCVGKYIYDEWDRIHDVHIHQGEISFFVNVFWRQNTSPQNSWFITQSQLGPESQSLALWIAVSQFHSPPPESIPGGLQSVMTPSAIARGTCSRMHCVFFLISC